MGQHTSWRLTSLLVVTPELAQCFASNNTQSPGEVIPRLLLSQILSQLCPLANHIINVDVRYKLSDLVPTCSKLPFRGYVQSLGKLEEYILQRWFSVEWSPVGGHCSRSPAYMTFREPHPGYCHLSLYGKPALK
jgi:hypothetical protein